MTASPSTPSLRCTPAARRKARQSLHAASLLACGSLATACMLPWVGTPAHAATGAGGNAIEGSPNATVYPILSPTSAIQVPLSFAADETNVWQSGGEQRMLLQGRVLVKVGYRLLRADGAAVWLTPSRESGENTYDVAIYLNGNVQVREGDRKTATQTVGRELLVTTRVMQSVLHAGPLTNKAAEDSPLVARGNEIRQELLNRPTAPMHAPPAPVITTAEAALQSGWIARGPNNKMILGPGDIQVVRDAQGNIIPTEQTANATQPAKPRPDLLILVDETRIFEVGNEYAIVIPNVYVIYDRHDGKPPLEFRAQRMVAFAPKNAQNNPNAAAGADLIKNISAAYMEGDVTIDQGDQLGVRAERVFYEFTTDRAVMLDAVLSAVDEVRNVPLYLRADEIRQLARGEYAAKKVTFSTSEFHTPHYHIGASEVYLRDITPELAGPGGSSITGGAGGTAGFGIGGFGNSGGEGGQRTYQFEAKDTTLNVQGVPVFYWPFLAGDTGRNEIPLRTIRVSNSRTYGPSILTDWDIFGLAGQHAPEGLRADLNVDYFGKRGPAGGVQANWLTDDAHGILRSYALLDQGEDRLGRDREDLEPQSDTRGRATFRDQRDLGEGLTLQLEASYISDPTFLEQFFRHEFDTDKEQETSIYLKKQGETDALTLLGKFNLFDFTANADRVDDQFTTEKKPEVKYWRIGDSFLDLFTYYSETGGANVSQSFTDYTPNQLGLGPTFLGPPAGLVPLNVKYRDYYRQLGWTDGDVLRGDTRHELDMPLQVGDAKIVPYVSGRVTVWDDAFPETESGTTTRVWGTTGIRSSMQFWKVYNDVESTLFDVHRLRHVIEPQFNVFVAGTDQDRRDLQPFDRDVEGISGASGHQLAINQKWQTKRGGEGHWRNVDWITLNVSWNQFYNEDKTGLFFQQRPLRGYYFMSRPELSLVRDSISVDGTWRIGEWVRFLGEANYNLQDGNIEQAAGGIAVDQSPSLSYFIGNRYVRELNTHEVTFAVDYALTKKYQLIAAESYDFNIGNNILTSVTLVRRMPRFNTALTVTYDANNNDTTVSVTAWPEGFTSNYNNPAARGFAER